LLFRQGVPPHATYLFKHALVQDAAYGTLLRASPRAPYPCGIPLDRPDCLIVLPIAPDTVFFASANPKTKDKVRKMAPGRVARIVNEEMIWRSSSCIYFSDTSLGAFVGPRISGKVKGAWQPSKL
jgi:hypothetical protein